MSETASYQGDPWLIFEPVPDTNLTVWKYVGEVPAHGREQARNRFYRGRQQPVDCCAVSAAQWQPGTWQPPLRVSARTTPLEMPKTPAGDDPPGPPPEEVQATLRAVADGEEA